MRIGSVLEPSSRGAIATKQSRLLPRKDSGLLRGACHRAALRADPLARNDSNHAGVERNASQEGGVVCAVGERQFVCALPSVSSRASKARPGTHNHRQLLLRRREPRPRKRTAPLWLWVPAFAGTTSNFWHFASLAMTVLSGPHAASSVAPPGAGRVQPTRSAGLKPQAAFTKVDLAMVALPPRWMSRSVTLRMSLPRVSTDSPRR